MAEYTKAQIAKVVKLRKQGLSWTNVRRALAEGKTGITISGSTVRRLYDLGEGRKGAYQEFYPLPGGRRASGETEPTENGDKAKLREARKANRAVAKAKASAGTKNGAAAGQPAKRTRKASSIKTTKGDVPPLSAEEQAKNGSTPAKRTARKAVKAVKANA